MKLKQLMERAAIQEAGKAVSMIKSALMEAEGLASLNIVDGPKQELIEDQRFYEIPSAAITVESINIKNQDNNEGEYRSIQRLLYEPTMKDPDET